jgi:hypothetical protein
VPDDLTHYAPPLDFRQRSVTPRRFANWWCGWVSMSSMGPQRCFVHCWFRRASSPLQERGPCLRSPPHSATRPTTR